MCACAAQLACAAAAATGHERPSAAEASDVRQNNKNSMLPDLGALTQCAALDD